MTMKSYYRVMLGRKSVHAAECFAGNFIGADFGINQDLSQKLSEHWRDFNHEFVPVFMASHPDKTKIGAGLACGALWTVCKGIAAGDIVICPDGAGLYRVGEISGDYYYQPGTSLPHRRPVRWLEHTIQRSIMSSELKSSTGSIGTVSNITSYRDEIEKARSTTSTRKTRNASASNTQRILVRWISSPSARTRRAC
jgi:restriction system protein